MKLLQCSLAALIGVILAKLLLAQTSVPFDVTRPLDGQPSRIEVKGGVSGVWLIVGRANTQDPLGKGFDPSYTYLLVNYKPKVKQLKDGRWLIQFTSEIAEDIP
jgi:hypothetical protein